MANQVFDNAVNQIKTSIDNSFDPLKPNNQVQVINTYNHCGDISVFGKFGQKNVFSIVCDTLVNNMPVVVNALVYYAYSKKENSVTRSTLIVSTKGLTQATDLKHEISADVLRALSFFGIIHDRQKSGPINRGQNSLMADQLKSISQIPTNARFVVVYGKSGQKTEFLDNDSAYQVVRFFYDVTTDANRASYAANGRHAQLMRDRNAAPATASPVKKDEKKQKSKSSPKSTPKQNVVEAEADEEKFARMENALAAFAMNNKEDDDEVNVQTEAGTETQA